MQGDFRIDLVRHGDTQPAIWRLAEHVEKDIVIYDDIRAWLQQTTPQADLQEIFEDGCDCDVYIEFDNQEDLAEFVLKWL